MGVDALGTAVGFGRALRAAGLAVDPLRLQAFVRATEALNSSSRADVYWSGRLTLCSTSDDIERYDRVFAAYWEGERVGQKRSEQQPDLRLVPADNDVDDGDEAATAVEVGVSAASEVLRHRDFADIAAADRELVNLLLAACSLPPETRRSRRYVRTTTGGRVDPRRTTRALIDSGGEVGRLHRRRHDVRPRRVVLLIDVSGSMAPYADALLRFAHASVRAREGHGHPIEVFTVGTRLTRVTPALHHRDPDVAMAEIAAVVPDWSGGTRLGILLREWLIGWGRRGMARGAVVVVLSDGWERDDVSALRDAMESLALLAHRVVWANPRKGRAGFSPTAAGMAAALPYVDDLVEGHSIAALQHLAMVVAGRSTR